MRVLLILVAAGLPLAGCGSGAPGATVPPTTDSTPPSAPSTTTTPDEEAVVLPQSGGCADAYFWAAGADGTHALTVYVDVRDRPTTEPTELDLTLPDPAATVTLQRGSDLTQAFCNDVLDQDYELDEEVPVVEGTLHLTVDPPPGDGGFVNGTVVLTGLVALDGTRIADLEITTDMIGMYAG